MPEHRRLMIEGENPDFPLDLSNLTVVKHHPGGSGGVYEVSDGTRTYMFKFSGTEEHLKKEILADALCRALDAKVPDFAVYEHPPEPLIKAMEQLSGRSFSNKTLCRLSKKIEGKIPTLEDIETLSASLKKYFVLYAYLRNRDIAKLDNLILTPDGQVYCIDNGAFLGTRALGEESLEDISHVIDLDTLRNPELSPLGSQFFNALTPEEIQQQIRALLTQQSTILNTALELNTILKIDFFDVIYEQLVNRMHSLVDDCSITQVEVDRRPTQGNAAGIFNIAYVAGKPYVLLGSRTGRHQDTWCTLGGSADSEDTTFHATAAREVFEESNEVLRYSEDEIRYHPFFDINIGPGQIYRMYISPTYYREASLMTEHLELSIEAKHREYEQFAWVSLESLIEGIDSEEETIAVHRLNEATSPASTIEESLALYPDMRRMLRTSGVKKTLLSFLDKRPILPLRPAEWQEKLAKTMSDRAYVIQELQQTFKEPREETPVPAQEIPSLSEQHLDGLLSPTTPGLESMPLKDKLDLFLDKQALGGGGAYDENCRDQLRLAIQKETEYLGQGYTTIYHAVPQKIAVLYDLYTALYQQLHLMKESDYKKFRLSELPFKSFGTLADFMAHFNRFGTINNYDEDYADLALSANPFMLGSSGDISSASYYLFATKDNSYGATFDHILEKNLGLMGLNDSMIRLLLGRLRAVLLDSQSVGGTLYQIHLPNIDVTNFCYPSLPGGKEWAGGGTLTSLLESFRAGGLSQEMADRLQVRFFVHPAAMANAVVQAYPSRLRSTDEEKTYAQTIRESAALLFQELLKTQAPSAFLENPAASTVYQGVLSELTGKQHRDADPMPLFQKIMGSRQYIKIRHLLNTYPALFSSEQAITLLCDNIIPGSLRLHTALENISKESYLTLCKAIQDNAMQMIKTNDDLGIVLRWLLPNQDKTAFDFDRIKSNFIPLIKTAQDLEHVMIHLTPAQRMMISEAMGDKLLIKLITTAEHLRFLHYLTPDKCSRICTKIPKERLSEIIKKEGGFNTVFHCFSREQISAVIPSMEGIWTDAILTDRDLLCLSPSLSLEQFKAICTQIKPTLPDCFRKPRCFGNLVRHFPSKQQIVMYEMIEDSLPLMINKEMDLVWIGRNLPEEQRKLCLIAIKSKWIEVAENDGFVVMMNYAPSLRMEFCDALDWNNQLLDTFTAHHELPNIFSEIKPCMASLTKLIGATTNAVHKDALIEYQNGVATSMNAFLVAISYDKDKLRKSITQLKEAIMSHTDCVTSALKKEAGLWRNLSPIIKGILGVLAVLTLIPSVVVQALARHGLVGTFFNTPETKAAKKFDAEKEQLDAVLNKLPKLDQ